MFHGQHILGQQVPGVAAYQCHAQNLVAARARQHFDKALRVAVGNGPVQLGQFKAADLKGHLLRARLCFVQAHARHLGVGEGGAR